MQFVSSNGTQTWERPSTNHHHNIPQLLPGFGERPCICSLLFTERPCGAADDTMAPRAIPPHPGAAGSSRQSGTHGNGRLPSCENSTSRHCQVLMSIWQGVQLKSSPSTPYPYPCIVSCPTLFEAQGQPQWNFRVGGTNHHATDRLTRSIFHELLHRQCPSFP